MHESTALDISPVPMPLFRCTFLLPAFSILAFAAAPYAGKLGVEANGDAFVDVVRQSYRWEKPDGHDGWVKPARDDLDTCGWPLSDCRWILDWRPCAEWTGHIDDPDAYRVDHSGVYRGSFTGAARLTIGGGSFSLANQTYNAAANRTTFDLVLPKPLTNGDLIILKFTDTQRAPGSPKNTGISDFKLIRPGYPAETKQLFTNEYLACLKAAAFSTIRFMDVTCVNGNVAWGKDHTRQQSWDNRKSPTDASVEPIEQLGKQDGWPWEFAVELCNQTNTDMWVNIPASADDDYIRHLAELLKAGLKPTLNIYIEHSNEVWNFGFLQYSWNKARAKEEVKEGHTRYNYDNVNDEEIWAQRRHAQRVKDAVDIFAGVFGMSEINKRIRGVLAGNTPDPEGFFICGRISSMLDYLKATNGDPANSIYAISRAAYYGGKGASAGPGAEHYSVDQILADMKENIEKDKKDRMAMVAVAKKFNLPGGYCAYESGTDTGGGHAENIANRIRAVRDPRQGTLFKENLTAGFWDLGGNLAMQFTLCSPYSRFGTWGLTDDIAKPDRNALFPAARDLVGEK
jgi:hypothetical protein